MGLTGSINAVPGIDLKHFWGKVFDVAELARRLAKLKGMKGEEVFTCALLYDMGRLIMHVGLPENMVNHIKDLEPSKGRAKAEELVVGFQLCPDRGRDGQALAIPPEHLPCGGVSLQPLAGQGVLCRGRLQIRL